MKKAFTFLAVMALLSSACFAQSAARRGQNGKPAMTPAAAFKAHLKKQAAKAPVKAAGDTISVFPWSEGFEAATAGFTFVDSDNDGYNWELKYASVENFSVNSGDACIVSASYDDDAGALTPDNWMILPVMEIPYDASDYVLSWYEKAQDANYSDEYYSVYINTTGNEVSDFTASTAVYSGYATGDWVKRSVDLSSYAGQTIHIAFRHYNCTDMFYLNIDDIRIGGPEPPTVALYGPTSVAQNVPATFIAVSDVTNLEWFVNGAPQSTTGDTLTVTFTTPGIYEVIVDATNTVGTTSDTLNVDVFSCDDITIPYTPNFAGGLGCWFSRSDSTESGWYASVEMFESDPMGQVLSMSAQSVWGIFMMDFPADNWLISPVIEMPAPAAEYEIAWQVAPFAAEYDGDHYGVYIIEGTDTTLLFEESLTGMTDFTQRMAIIPSTVSGDFQFAFRHFNSVGGYVIILDSIQVRPLTAPALTLNGPTSAENGSDVSFVAVCPNATSFAWTVDGNDVSETSNTLTTSFTLDGNHTVAVTATNSVGTVSEDITVEIYTCTVVTSFPYVMDFESGARCWDMVSMDPANDNNFGLQDQYVTSGVAGFKFSSYASASDYNQYLISPELSLPAGSYMVTFPYMAQEAEDVFRIMASTTDKNISSFVEIADFSTITAGEWGTGAAILPAGTKYVAIDYYGNYAYYLYIDDVTIKELTEAPEVTLNGPTSALTDDDVTFVAVAPLATSFSWTVDGSAVSGSSNTLTTSFATGGNHTVTVTATNAIGSNSANATINIISCDLITQFPFVADFDDENYDYTCWKVIDADGDGYNWMPQSGTSQTGAGYGHNSNGALFSASYINDYGALTPDNWLILPAMTIPASGEIELSWYAKGQDANYAEEHYSVYVSTSGSTVESFTTQLYSGFSTDQWTKQTANLAEYAGQTIRIAFRHHDVTDMFYLVIDDIRVAAPGAGIDDVMNSNFSVYPNPASDKVNVSLAGVEGTVNVQIVDITGRTVKELNGNAQGMNIEVSDLSRGTYFVHMTGENVNAVRKLILK